MAAPPKSSAEPITDRRQLVSYLEAGSKPVTDWRIGTEHEKFVYRLSDLRPVAYDGPQGIAELLTRMIRFGWQPWEENGAIIALTCGAANVTLEPGGQVELSGAPLETLHQTCAEIQTHLAQVKEIDAELGIGMIGLGFNPKWSRADIPWMPKGRYQIMRDYMPKRGALGIDMMLRTCTVQVNLDFASEADMVSKFRVSLALQPLATALFASSPFTEGKPNGFQSYRSHIWTDTDPDRCGDLPFVFEDGFGFERYVDYALDVPMYFVYRNGRYIDASGQSFRDFLDGRLPMLPGQQPLMSDWADHLTTLFPEVRLKRFLEMRGADCGPSGRLCALSAFWVGLLYDDQALDAATRMVADWSAEDRAYLRREVPRHGLATPFRGRPLQALAVETVALSRQGLNRRARLDSWGNNESHFVEPLMTIAERNETLASELLGRFHKQWQGQIDPIFNEYAY
ncbi:MAG: glutamate--cysteine ligase [Azospirillaceae bacterium]|nr:glutamate--cysteine ligase [Azospirillaceae bacterium]